MTAAAFLPVSGRARAGTLPARPILAGLVACLLASALGVPPARSAPVPAPSESDATAPAASDALALLSRRLAQRVEAALADRCLSNARLALTVRDVETGRTLFTKAGDEPMVPASNVKLLTAAAALSLLGPEHRRHTDFRAEHRPDGNGGVGTLWVVGGGDPAFNVESLYLAARALAVAGVRRVDDVVVDDGLFGDDGRAPSWPERNHPHWYGAPASALSCAFNVVAVHARGAAPGTPAEAWLDPFPSFFEIQNRVVSGRGPFRVRTDEVVPASPGQPGQRLTLLGHVRPGRTERELRAVEDPALFCAHGLVETLRRVGIEVDGVPRRGRVPAESVRLHAHPSRPLSLIVHDMNKQSSNVFAETLLRVLGAEMLGAPGTREKGLAVLEAFLQQASARTSGVRLEDGSGLSPSNRITANVLTDLLLAVRADPLVWPEFVVALPVGGIDGTLKRRLSNGRAERLVRAKTGRLARVVSLTGFAPVEDGRPVVFSLMVNDYHCATWKVQRSVDRLVESLVAGAEPAPEPGSRLSVRAPGEIADERAGAGEGS